MARRWLFAIALFGLLLAPSIWLFVHIPPLWRDSDSYFQVTGSAAKATYWGHGPLYCFIARVPLWIGERWEGLSRGDIDAFLRPALRSHLTDTGVLLLILLQHTAHAAAAWLFIVTVSSFGWVRLALGVLWTAATAFYTYAQCVGSETLSMICILLFVTVGLRIMRRERAPRRDWIWFAATLWACLLARYVNIWLILVLPLTFGFLAIQARYGSGLNGPAGRSRSHLRSTWNFRRASLVLALGLFCFAAADLSTRTICRIAGLQFHSRIGHTFLWRLQFLKDLSRAERDQLLDRVQAHARSPEAARLVPVLRDTFDRGDAISAQVFENQARTVLFAPTTKHRGERADEALNALALSFLLPPNPEHLGEARADFHRARLMTLGDIAQFLFATTAFYWDHQDWMVQCAGLVTFRGTSPAAILALPSQHRYFRLGTTFTYNRCLMLWLVALLALVLLPRRRGRGAKRLIFYAISLTFTGLAMTASTCVLGELLPRYTLPMWELLWISLFLIVGTFLDVVCDRVAARHHKQVGVVSR